MVRGAMGAKESTSPCSVHTPRGAMPQSKQKGFQHIFPSNSKIPITFSLWSPHLLGMHLRERGTDGCNPEQPCPLPEIAGYGDKAQGKKTL